MAELERLIITCGGTGGHFYPGLSIARTFQQRGGKVLLLLSGIHAAAQAKSAAQFGIEAVELPEMPSPRKAPCRFLRGLVGGYAEAKRCFHAFAPQAMLGMGSFAQLPAVLAARSCRVPIFLHDGNARIGKANRVLSRFARMLGAGFPPVNGSACRCPVSDIGMPVRPELLQYRGITRAEAMAQLEKNFGVRLDPAQPVLLVFGGSQGAAVLNRTLPEAVKNLPEPLQILHLTGKGKLEETSRRYAQSRPPALLLETHEHIEWFFGAADWVICRSGGSTLAEVALFGKPALLVPYPYAAEGHQQDNADCFVRAGAALCCRDRDFTPEYAAARIEEFFADPESWKRRGKAALTLARPNAAGKMLAEISDRLRN